jgi:hypothetical protein
MSTVNPAIGGNNSPALNEPALDETNSDPANKVNDSATVSQAYYADYATTVGNTGDGSTLNVSATDANPSANRNNVQLIAQNDAKFELPRPVVDKGQSGSHMNRIQVPNDNNSPAQTKLNQRLDKIYQDSYVRPMQAAIGDFKRTTGWGAAGTGGSAGVWGLWNTIVSKSSNIPTAAAMLVGNIGIGGAAGSVLRDKVTAATTDYLQQANAELKANNYRPVDHL